jgi:hypothetical protein
MAFAAGSPLYAGFGSMPMLEIFGAVLTAWAAALYLKNSRWFPLSLTLLFFMKYNYFLYLALPILALSAWDYKKTRTAKNIVQQITPFGWFVIAYAFVLALIVVTGGFKIGKLSVRGIANPLYALLLIILIRGFVKGQHRTAWRSIRGSGWEWFAVPVLIWLLIPVPNRIHTLVNFAVNAPLGGQRPGEIEYYTFYFKALPAYFSTWWLALICGMLAILAAVMQRSRRVLFLVLLFGLAFVLMTANQNKQERFLFTFVFALWMLAAVAVAAMPRIVRIAAALILCAGCLYYYDISKLHETVAWPFIPLTAENAVREVAVEAAQTQSVVVLGAQNDMSPALIAYHTWKLTGDTNRPKFYWELQKSLPPGTKVISVNSEFLR